MATEDHWTPPSPWCPSPSWWHADADDADAAEHEVSALVTALIRAAQPEVVVETGTATGATAVMIGDALKANRHGWLWTVEVDGNAAKIATEAVQGLPVTVICASSLEWDPPDRIDFAWIDSGIADIRVGEIRKWRSKFSSGAIVAVHDTAPNMGREALHDYLHEVLRELGWPSLSLRTPRGIMLAQVP